MKYSQLIAAVQNVTGASFIGLDTLTEPTLRKTLPDPVNPRRAGTSPNPHFGRITKRMIGANVMVFTNKNGSAYEGMVQRRLVQEGKDPANFILQPRKWGIRVPNFPIVTHEKDGMTKYYLEVIFLKNGTIEYLLDNQPIPKHEIIGLQESEVAADAQGGLDNLVIIRTFDATSITQLRIDGQVWV